MALWVIRAGSKSAIADEVIEKKIATIDWGFAESLAPLTIEEVKAKIPTYLPDLKPGAVGLTAWMLFRLAHRITVGDWIVFPAQHRNTFHIGQVTGSYQYYPKGILKYNDSLFRHAIPVQWLDEEINKEDLPREIRNSLGSTLSLFAIRPDQEKIVLSLLKTPIPTSPIVTTTNTAYPEAVKEEEIKEIEELSNNLITEANMIDVIREHIYAHFKEHDLTGLITALLEAQGFYCYQSPPGPDGGVDIIAGHGSFGFQAPRICVQVKSGKQIMDVKAVRELEGTLSRFQADYALFVSWSGFNKSAEKLLNERFLKLRSWTSKDIVEQVFKYYEVLPLEIKQKLPLKRCWILTETNTL